MHGPGRRDLALATPRILACVEDGIGWVTFNQPEKRNAMSMDMWQGLGDALAAFQADTSVRVVVMRGAGGKAFVSGADISEFDQHRASAAQRAHYGQASAHGNRWLARLDKPLLAMIQGFCIGGGLATALAADVRFATPGSTFGIPAARLGLGYDYGGVARLARIVGPACARDILFSARFLDTDEALRIGLVNFVVDDAALEGEVVAYARRIAANAPLTLRAAKAALDAFEREPGSRDLEAVDALVNACFDSEDYREGRRAFAEKRPPVFRGS
jgi:enoyl-CoA hydratase/carnithine racemase